jgi:flagellar biogenesis protein FliO
MDLIQPFCAVLLVLGLLGGTLLFLKNKGAASFHLPRRASAGPRRMEVVERVALGPQHALHLVRVGNRSVVVATGPSSCQLLCEETQ